MQALVIRDKFDDIEMVNSLYEHLKGFKIVEIKSIRELNSAKILLNPNLPCLIYSNIFMRIEDPKEIWEFHKGKLFNNTVKIGTEIVSVIPRSINNYARDINTLTYMSPEFTVNNKKVYYVKNT